jgi:outer membrane protein OmpA-like peptidoglycan-associated protein
MLAIGWTLCLHSAMALAASPGGAQPPPDTEQIVEALKPSPSRSTRNLVARDRPVGPGVARADAPGSIELTIQFDFDSSSIREESRPLLARLAAALMSPELRSSRFLIEGHTDAVGAPGHNMKLSIGRAEEIMRFLVAYGVTPSRVAAVGRGATQPANPADPEASENRRVRIVNLQ